MGPEKIGCEIRDATWQKVPYLRVVGEQEAAAGTVAVRHRTAGDQGAVPLADFVVRARVEVADRAIAPASVVAAAVA